MKSSSRLAGFTLSGVPLVASAAAASETPQKPRIMRLGAREATYLPLLEGQGAMRISGAAGVKCEKGVALYCPPMTEHDVFNTGGTPLRYVFVVAKALGGGISDAHP